MPSRDHVNYRPGRIQSINAEQEVVLKQTWAMLLKFWGYKVNIADSDLQYPSCFIPSTSTVHYEPSQGNNNGYLSRTATRTSIGSGTSNKTGVSTSSKMKRGLFGKKQAQAPASAPSDSKRMMQIQTQSSMERYQPVTKPSEETRYIFANFYKQSFANDDDYFSDGGEAVDDESDAASIESFATAESNLSDPEDLAFAVYKARKAEADKKKGKKKKHAKHKPAKPKVKSGKPGLSTKSFKVVPNTRIASFTDKYNPHELHNALVTSMRQDLVDNFVLRFVRARKWNADNALAMIMKSMNWRANEFSVNEWAMEADGASYINGTNKGFIKNFTTEKSWVAGHDKNQNPLFFFLARKHFGSDSPLPETQRFAIVSIESTRLFMREVNESVDQCSVVFDLTGFTLKNADNYAIKFLADCFEAHYPECLGCILIHNAPWIFSTVWNIIKNWLDPVVAAKIHFTKDYKELCNFIEPRFIPKDFGGEAGADSTYVPPERRDLSPPKRKDATYRKLRLERDETLMKFIDVTIKWIEATSPMVSDNYLQDKIELNYALSRIYIEMDGYVRCRGIYDRNGSMNLRN